MPKTSLIKKIIEHLESLPPKKESTFTIPGAWLQKVDDEYVPNAPDILTINPVPFYIRRLHAIMEHNEPQKNYRNSLGTLHGEDAGGTWIRSARIYALYVRTFTAWDHDQDGELGGMKKDITLNKKGYRETGTFLKTLMMLPYIKHLGCNTIYLLPVSLNDRVNQKGELPSPYAQKDPFQIEPSLGDPLSGLSAEDEFKALVEGAHRLDMRVMLDFIFRTASKASSWIEQHPDWFYWIEKDREYEFSPPYFSDDQLQEIRQRVEIEKDFTNLIEPDEEYRSLFSSPPLPEEIKLKSKQSGYEATVNQKKVVIPGAFADWPPDDIQPPWSDVTYLKLYTDPQFNYVAYNTVRMYDTRIKKKNKALWDMLESIIPYYQETFGIDGARIDMGHALPDELERGIIKKARTVDPSFAFLSEDFNPRNPHALEQGYDALWASSWYMQCRHADESEGGLVNRFVEFMEELPDNELPVLGTPETFDTPRAITRAGGKVFARLAMSLNGVLPHVIPFIPAGMEFFEDQPCNLGLDFTEEYIQNFRGKLAFFNRTRLSWNLEGMQDEIRKIYGLREIFENFFAGKDTIFQPIPAGSTDLYSFILAQPNHEDFIWVMVNFSLEHPSIIESELPIMGDEPYLLENLLQQNETLPDDAFIDEVLEPGEVRLYRLHQERDGDESYDF